MAPAQRQHSASTAPSVGDMWERSSRPSYIHSMAYALHPLTKVLLWCRDCRELLRCLPGWAASRPGFRTRARDVCVNDKILSVRNPCGVNHHSLVILGSFFSFFQLFFSSQTRAIVLRDHNCLHSFWHNIIFLPARFSARKFVLGESIVFCSNELASCLYSCRFGSLIRMSFGLLSTKSIRNTEIKRKTET